MLSVFSPTSTCLFRPIIEPAKASNNTIGPNRPANMTSPVEMLKNGVLADAPRKSEPLFAAAEVILVQDLGKTERAASDSYRIGSPGRVGQNSWDQDYYRMNQEREHYKENILPGDLHPQIFWGSPGHQPNDEYGDQNIHHHIHHAHTLTSWCRLNQHAHEGS